METGRCGLWTTSVLLHQQLAGTKWIRLDQAATPQSSSRRTKGQTRGPQQTFYLPGGTDENSGAKTAGRRGRWMVVV